MVAFVVVVLILNTRGGAHVPRIVHYFFLLLFDSTPFSFHLLPIADYFILLRGDKSDAKLFYVKTCNLLPASRIKYVARNF